MSPETETCGNVWTCGPECCNDELATCDLPKGHEGRHSNTIQWDNEAPWAT